MRGFTLIEMMVVIVILGILAAITGAVVITKIDKARFEGTQFKIKQMAGCVAAFKLDQGRLPERLEDLVRRPAYVEARSWPADGYWEESLADGWNRELIYSVPGAEGRSFDLLSLGADGRPGGDGYDADLSNHRMK